MFVYFFPENLMEKIWVEIFGRKNEGKMKILKTRNFRNSKIFVFFSRKFSISKRNIFFNRSQLRGYLIFIGSDKSLDLESLGDIPDAPAHVLPSPRAFAAVHPRWKLIISSFPTQHSKWSDSGDIKIMNHISAKECSNRLQGALGRAQTPVCLAIACGTSEGGEWCVETECLH